MREKLYALQTLRAVAAAFVVFVHANSTYLSKVDGASVSTFTFPSGESGVQLFFAISGFIIYTASINMPMGMASARLFAWRRISRVVPLYWLATCIYAVKLALTTGSPTFYEIGKSLFFIPYGMSLMRPVLGVGWTLNYEMFFYFIFFLTLFSPKVWRLPAMLVFFGIVRICGESGVFDGPNGSWPLAHLSEAFLDYFMVGMLIAYGRARLQDSDYKVELSCSATIAVSLGIFVLGFAGLGTFGIDHGLFPVLVVSASLAVATLEGRKTADDSRRYHWLTAAGDASFSTYLTHGFVMGPIARVLNLAHIQMPVQLFSIAMVIICSACGYIVFRLVESPMLVKFTPGRKKVSALA